MIRVGFGQREIECRWVADESARPASLFARAVKLARDTGFSVGPLTRARLDDRYLDTSDRALEVEDIALRLRRSDELRRLTLKSRGEAPAPAGASRSEFVSARVDEEFEIDWDAAPPQRISDLPKSFRTRLPDGARGSLHEVLRLQQVRYEARLSSGSEEAASLSVDRIQRPFRQCRVELEVPVWSEEWQHFADHLAAELRLVPTSEDKLAAARERVGSAATATATASTTRKTADERNTDTPDRDASATDTERPPSWLESWLAEPLARHLEFSKRVCDDPRSKRIRRFRVTCRHLRTRLRILDAIEPLDGGRRVRRYLRSRARAFGDLRDLDVAIRRFDLFAPDEEPVLGPVHERVRRRLLEFRSQTAREAISRLRSERSNKHLRRICKLVDEVGRRPFDHDPRQLATASVPAAVAGLRIACERALDGGRVQDIHSARLSVKRLRYVCRAFRSSFDLASVEAALIPVQDRLGALQDAEATRSTILGLVSKKPSKSHPSFEDPEEILVLGAFLQRESDRLATALDESTRVLTGLMDLDWSIFEPNRWTANSDL